MTPTRRRMDPFQLPAATTSRFLLLIVLTLSATAYTAILLIGGPDGWNDEYRRCMAAANAATSLPPAVVTEQYVDCYRNANLQLAAVGLGAALLAAGLLLIGYVLHPLWLIRRQGLRSFDPAVFPATARMLDQLVAEAGLPRPPRFMIQPFRDSIGGRAFGRCLVLARPTSRRECSPWSPRRPSFRSSH